jgi:hypothetical protein
MKSPRSQDSAPKSNDRKLPPDQSFQLIGFGLSLLLGGICVEVCGISGNGFHAKLGLVFVEDKACLSPPLSTSTSSHFHQHVFLLSPHKPTPLCSPPQPMLDSVLIKMPFDHTCSVTVAAAASKVRLFNITFASKTYHWLKLVHSHLSRAAIAVNISLGGPILGEPTRQVKGSTLCLAFHATQFNHAQIILYQSNKVIYLFGGRPRADFLAEILVCFTREILPP